MSHIYPYSSGLLHWQWSIFIMISIFRLGCCPCHLQLQLGWQFYDYSSTSEVILKDIGKDDQGGRFKNTYELLNLRALKISKLHKNHIFQCMGKIFCVEFQRVPLKFHTKYLTHTLKDVDFINIWKFKSSLIYQTQQNTTKHGQLGNSWGILSPGFGKEGQHWQISHTYH